MKRSNSECTLASEPGVNPGEEGRQIDVVGGGMVFVLITAAEDEPLRIGLENMLQFQRVEVLVVLIAWRNWALDKDEDAVADDKGRNKEAGVREVVGVMEVAIKEEGVVSRTTIAGDSRGGNSGPAFRCCGSWGRAGNTRCSIG